jgi:hypothetical protein
MEIFFRVEGVTLRPKHENILNKIEIEYNQIIPIYNKLLSVDNKTIEQDMTFRGCFDRLREIKIQADSINKVKNVIVPTYNQTKKSINKHNESGCNKTTSVSSKLRCEIVPLNYSSDNNIVVKVTLTKGKPNKMIVMFNVFVGDIDSNGQCLVLQRPDRIKGNSIFDYAECRPLMDKAFAEYDWVLYKDDDSWIN